MMEGHSIRVLPYHQRERLVHAAIGQTYMRASHGMLKLGSAYTVTHDSTNHARNELYSM